MQLESTKELAKLISEFYNSTSGLILVALSTPDGFPIQQASDSFEGVPDKIAAMTSTLSSVSNAIAEEIIAAPFTLSWIETDDGDCVCVYTKYQKQNAVLTVAAKRNVTLGVLRVRIKRLAEKIALLKV